MALKKRAKVSAEFSMSSLTDIIFLLLIFFMLTSTLVKIQPFDLPESEAKTVATTDLVVAIRNDGSMTFNDTPFSNQRAIERAIISKIHEVPNKSSVTLTIAAEVGTPFDDVVKFMNLAGKQRVKAILATKPIE